MMTKLPIKETPKPVFQAIRIDLLDRLIDVTDRMIEPEKAPEGKVRKMQ